MAMRFNPYQYSLPDMLQTMATRIPYRYSTRDPRGTRPGINIPRPPDRATTYIDPQGNRSPLPRLPENVNWGGGRPPPRNFAVDPRGFKGGPRRRPNPFMNRGIGGMFGGFGGRGPRRRFNPFMGMRRPRRRSAFSNLFGGIGGMGRRRGFNPFMNRFGGGGFNPFERRHSESPRPDFSWLEQLLGQPTAQPTPATGPLSDPASRPGTYPMVETPMGPQPIGATASDDEGSPEGPVGPPPMAPVPPPIMYGGGTPDFDEMGSTAPVMPAAPQSLGPVIPEVTPALPTVGPPGTTITPPAPPEFDRFGGGRTMSGMGFADDRVPTTTPLGNALPPTQYVSPQEQFLME